MVWIQAALMRAKKMPPMEDLMMTKQGASKPDISARSRAMFEEHNAGVGKGHA